MTYKDPHGGPRVGQLAYESYDERHCDAVKLKQEMSSHVSIMLCDVNGVYLMMVTVPENFRVQRMAQAQAILNKEFLHWRKAVLPVRPETVPVRTVFRVDAVS